MFSTLNQRGIDLSISELVRSFLLEKSDKNDVRTHEKNWDTILDNLERKDLDNFLHHYWISEHGFIQRQHLFREIEKNVKKNKKIVKKIMTDLVHNSLSYALIRNPSKVNDDEYKKDPIAKKILQDEDIEIKLQELKEISNFNARPLILAAKNWDKINFKKLLEFCIAIHFRGKTLGPKTGGEMMNTMTDCAKIVRKQ
jgi:hypothetical protein